MLPLNSVNDPNKAATSGFASGLYIDGSTAFPGTGIFACGSTVVARIQTTSVESGRGAYTVCHSSRAYDNQQVKYFLPHPGLRWIRTNTSVGLNTPGAIKGFYSGLDYDLFVRVNLTMNNVTYQDITWLDGQRTGIWIGNSYQTYDGELDILTCSG